MTIPTHTSQVTFPRWAMLIVFIGITAALILIPPPYSTGIFAAMLAGSLFYGLAQIIPVRWLLMIAGVGLAVGFVWWLVDAATVSPPTDPPTMTREGLLAYDRAALPDSETFPWGDGTEAVAQVIGGLAVLAAGVAVWRRRWSAAVIVAAFALMTWSAYLFRPGALADTTQAVYVLVAGLAVMVVGGLVGTRPVLSAIAQNDIVTNRRDALLRIRRGTHVLRYALLGTLCLAALTAINGVDPTFVPTAGQLLLLTLGAGLLVTAARAYRPLVTIRVDGYGIALMGVLLVAFGLRIAELETLIHRHIDEIASIESVMELHADPALHLLRPYEGVARFTRLYSLAQSWSLAIFGPSLAGLRLISAFAGTLTVGAVYLLGRELFDRKTALVAALLLATFPPHIHFSRAGINNIVDPLFGTLALAFLARGLRRSIPEAPRLTDFALAGVMLGLTQYFYEGGRLLFPPLVLILAAINLRRLRWQGGLVLAGTAVLVGAPVYLTLIAGDYTLAPRLEGAGRDSDYWRHIFAGDLQQDIHNYWRRNLRFPLWHFTQRADLSGFYGGQTALLLTAVMPFFFLGLGRAIGRVWRLPGAMLSLWLLGTAIGNSLLVNPLESARYVVAFPAVALVIAWGLCMLVDALVSLLASASSGRAEARPYNNTHKHSRDRACPVRRAHVLSLMAVTLALAAIHGVYYVRVHAPGYMLQYTDATAVEDVYFRALDLPDRTHIHLVTDELVYGRELYVILEFHDRFNTQIFMTQVDPRMLTAAYLNGRPSAQRYAIFVPPYETALVDQLTAHGGWEQITRSPHNIPDALNYWMFLDSR